MATQEIVRRYEQLMRDIEWLGEGMAWTVLMPEKESLPISEIISRLSLPEGSLLPDLEVGLSEIAYINTRYACTALFEPEGFSHVGYGPNLERLATDNHVWHVSWNITGRSMLKVAKNGQVQVEILDLDPAMAHGIGLDIVGDYLPLLRSASRRKWPALRATAMAIVETVTGTRLDQEWIGQPQSGLAITRPPLGS
ncbi:hypothetical protein Misp01_58470 [Microtetraspora sp. NBRC 13810]|uniref:hypothetical protein n=1 Tax=Microtetraspora sp. NBRC 13810 TaxID=3030990 RepID=UPI0024A5BE97|nr:hypothetical protein [Microtetraspora sp. NBRC 13810]GLW10719.1 hypothetical protein Misp01_58470 [Microtetraspora sp. NBRC 13810]